MLKCDLISPVAPPEKTVYFPTYLSASFCWYQITTMAIFIVEVDHDALQHYLPLLRWRMASLSGMRAQAVISVTLTVFCLIYDGAGCYLCYDGAITSVMMVQAVYPCYDCAGYLCYDGASYLFSTDKLLMLFPH